MPKIEIKVGHYYRGKTSFLRKVTEYDGDRVRWHDSIGPGNCSVSTFRSWLKVDVSHEDDPEIEKIEAALAESETKNAMMFDGIAALMEEVHVSQDVTVWTTPRQMPPVMRKFYAEANGRKAKLKWICWVPKKREVPAFCREDGIKIFKVKDKGAFHVRIESRSLGELIDTAFSDGRTVREQGGKPLTYMELRGIFVELGAENDRRLLKSLYNVWVAGYNSAETKAADMPYFGAPSRGIR